SLLEQTHAQKLAWVETPNESGGAVVWHDGGTLGCSAFIGFDKQRRRGVVVLKNARGAPAGGWLGRFLLARDWRTERRPAGTNGQGEDLDAFVGLYRSAASPPSLAISNWALCLLIGIVVVAGCVVVRFAGVRWRVACLCGAILVFGAGSALLRKSILAAEA